MENLNFAIMDLFVIFLLLLFWGTLIYRIWQRLYFTAAFNSIAVAVLTPIMFSPGERDFGFLALLILWALFTFKLSSMIMQKEMKQQKEG